MLSFRFKRGLVNKKVDTRHLKAVLRKSSICTKFAIVKKKKKKIFSFL